MAQTYTIRPFQPEDQAFLYEMLYQAMFIPEGHDPAPREVIYEPYLRKYVEDFGQQPDDLAYLAIDNVTQQPVGAVWLRLLIGEKQGYGYVDDTTPELSIALMPDQRGRGIGQALLEQLLTAAKQKYRKVSLSVWTANPAFRLYQRLGFQIVAEHEPDVTMVKWFDTDNAE